MENRSNRMRRSWIAALVVVACGTLGTNCPGLSPLAWLELHAAGVDKYVGEFTPASSEPAGEWTKHTFDSDGGNGPTCIDGSDFTVFTRPGNPFKLLFFLNGGGACWQNFYFCSQQATQGLPPEFPGIFADSFDTGTEIIDNPLADYSMVFVSYCDGSVFSGDNDVADPVYQAIFGPELRRHRGLRNLTAAMDLAKDEFPAALRVVVAGSSAGGVGAAGFAPFVARFVYGNFTDLAVFNDAGPVHVNLDETASIAARAADWQFGQFYPGSCTDCDDLGKATAVIEWRLTHDNQVRESFYSTDGDGTNRFFLNVPTQAQYRALVLGDHDPIHDAFPNRYKRFIRSGDDSHTALGSPLYYVGEVDGVPLYQWTEAFVKHEPGWVDLVEDFVPLP